MQTQRFHVDTVPWRSAFTLVELLVVITIIVILVAMLAPGLEKAIYAAELAVCQANQHAVGAGVTSYGMTFKRWYPYRPAVHDPKTGYYQPRSISIPFNSAQTNRLEGYDDRPLYAPFVDLDMLVCPPAGKVTIKYAEPGTYIQSSYNIWAGWKYHGGARTQVNAGNQQIKQITVAPPRGMLRVGDRMSYWYDTDFDGDYDTENFFRALTGDVCDVIWTGWTNAHPDSKGVLNPFVKQDEAWNEQGRAGRADPDAKTTEAGWYENVFSAPGTVDMNFAMDDLSALRIERMRWDGREHPWPWGDVEPRTKAVPCFADTWADNLNITAVPYP
jgi:prepilin-type N-terminal cleavage/methylation domain-containing protein